MLRPQSTIWHMKTSHGAWLRVLSLLMPGLILVAGCSTTQPDTKSTTSFEPITQSQPPSVSSLPDTLQESLQESLHEKLNSIMERYEVPGAEVLVVTPEGMWSTEQGVTDLESGDPIESGMAWPL